jgi:hypothetical protein
MFCWRCIIVYQYSETNVMHFLFNLLRIKGLYMFRASLAHPQEALHKRHLIYCVRVMSVGCRHFLFNLLRIRASTYFEQVRRADKLTTFMCQLSWTLGASTSWKRQGLSRPVTGLLYLINRGSVQLGVFEVSLLYHSFGHVSLWPPPILLLIHLCLLSRMYSILYLVL